MNTPHRSLTSINTASYSTEFQPLLREKSENFVGREFVFAAIDEFLHQSNRGYFTLVGAPGSGKSAILAKYATENPHVIYYNAQVEGKNRADQFLTTICTQLMGSLDVAVPDNATEGSWFLSLLLQQISDNLEPDQRLIIAIDALDAIDPNSQSASSNLFYLPRYLPQKVYFLLSRRPFLRDKSGLLIETPSQIFDLGDYPEQNREDVQTYIRNYLTPLDPPQPPLNKGGLRSKSKGELRSKNKGGLRSKNKGGLRSKNKEGLRSKSKEGLRTEESDSYSSSSISPPFLRGAGGDREGLGERSNRSNLKSWLTTHNISEEEFSDRLTQESENNFMYLSQILQALAQGFYPEPFQFNRLPPGLEAYYQSHWQHLIETPHIGVAGQNPVQDKDLSSVELAVLSLLVQQEQPISVEYLAQMLDEDEYEVEEILENWIEFLQQQEIGGETCYSLYHSSFRNWLSQLSRGFAADS